MLPNIIYVNKLELQEIFVNMQRNINILFIKYYFKYSEYKHFCTWMAYIYFEEIKDNNIY